MKSVASIGKSKIITDCNGNNVEICKDLIPDHFNDLLDIFVSLDIVVNKLLKKRVHLYLHRVSELLNESNKHFNREIFGQILTIFPEAYSYEFNKKPLKITRHYKEQIKLIANLSYGKLDNKPSEKAEKNFSMNQLLSRQISFYDRLLQIVKDKHNEFLKEISDPTTVINKYPTSDNCWHDQFDLNARIDPIVPKPLDDNSTHVETEDFLKIKTKPTINSSPLLKTTHQIFNVRKSVSSCKEAITAQKTKATEINKSPSIIKPVKCTVKKPIVSSPLVKSTEAKVSPAKPSLKKPATPKETKSVKSPTVKSTIEIPTKESNSTNDGVSSTSILKINKKSVTPSSLYKSNRQSVTKSPSVLPTPIQDFNRPSLRKSTGASPSISTRPSWNSSVTISTNTSPVVRKVNQSRLSFIVHKESPTKPVEPNPALKRRQYKNKLPFTLKSMYEQFVMLDKVVRDCFVKGELCFLDVIAPAVSTHVNFSDEHLGRILTIYPNSFELRWDKLSKTRARRTTLSTRKQFGIVISPNIISDGTISAQKISTNGLVEYRLQRLKERSDLFLEKCVAILADSYRAFLLEKMQIPAECVESHVNSDQWNEDFDADKYVRPIDPVPMPKKPDQTKTTCIEVTSMSQLFNLAKQRKSMMISQSKKAVPDQKAYAAKSSPVIDKTSKISPAPVKTLPASSKTTKISTVPRKTSLTSRTSSTSQISRASPKTTKTSPAPVRASPVTANNTKGISTLTPSNTSSVADKKATSKLPSRYKGLLNRVHENKAKYEEFGRPDPNDKTIIAKHLPKVARYIHFAFQNSAYRPQARDAVARILNQSMGVSYQMFNKYVSALAEAVPGWIIELKFRQPHLSIDHNLIKIDDVIAKLNSSLVCNEA